MKVTRETRQRTTRVRQCHASAKQSRMGNIDVMESFTIIDVGLNSREFARLLESEKIRLSGAKGIALNPLESSFEASA